MQQHAGTTSADVRGISCRKSIALALLLAFAVLLSVPCPASAFTQAAPKRLVLFAPEPVVVQGEVLVNLDITVDSEEGLANMLRDGAVLALGVTLSIERVRSWWANAEAAQKRYLSIIRHDPLTRDFIMELPIASGSKELRDKNISNLLQGSWRHLSLPLVSLAVLEAEEPADSYEILVTAELNHTEVPPWLEKSMLFWSSEVVPPQTRSVTLVPSAARRNSSNTRFSPDDGSATAFFARTLFARTLVDSLPGWITKLPAQFPPALSLFSRSVGLCPTP